MSNINLNDYSVYNFEQTVAFMENNAIKPFQLYIKNMLRNDLIPFDKRLEMFLYCEHLLPINTDFMWLDYDYELHHEIYKEVLRFDNVVLFKDLISLFNTLPDGYFYDLGVNKEVAIEHAVRSGYRGFIL